MLDSIFVPTVYSWITSCYLKVMSVWLKTAVGRQILTLFVVLIDRSGWKPYCYLSLISSNRHSSNFAKMFSRRVCILCCSVQVWFFPLELSLRLSTPAGKFQSSASEWFRISITLSELPLTAAIMISGNMFGPGAFLSLILLRALISSFLVNGGISA